MTKNKERFQVLFDNNPHPTWVYDLETLRFLEVNKAAVGKYGYSREEFLRMRITDIRPPEDVEPLLEALQKGRPELQSSQRRYTCKDGRVIPAAVTSHLATLNDRTVVVVVAEDITERLRAQEVLVRSKEEAERTTRFKDRFLSTMSHELRTPLNAILGFSELLCDECYGPLSERQRRYVEHIHTGGRHLLKLINEILDLSKIEAGRLDLAIESVRTDTAFGVVLDSMRPLADAKSQTLSHHTEGDLTVRADSTRLRQVLMNLVGNAIKFTPQGGRIEVAARQVEGRVRIEVRDTGQGIPPEEQKRIFEAFYRLQKSGEPAEGTGLGLAISKRIIELHGGQLGLESQPGQGSCFYFSLPAAIDISEPHEHETDSKSSANGSPRVLVIEDDPVAWQLTQLHLSSSGYKAIHCNDGKCAAEMAARLRPDAITLDLFMKPLNGWEVLAELKNDRRTAEIPVIVVTIADRPALGAVLGANEYLVKPVEKRALLAAIKRCLSNRNARASARPILVVEDHVPTREVIAELLAKQGYKVSIACDGAEARAMVAASLPELVILDLLLPKLSGFDLLSEWRTSSRTSELPVCVLTSKDLSPEEEKYIRAHAECLVRKEHPWQADLVQQLQRMALQPHLERA